MNIDQRYLLVGWVQRIKRQDSPKKISGIQDAIADAVDAVIGEIERLQIIVDKLPTTADGVPIVPGQRVYFRCGTCDGAVESMIPINSVSDHMSKTFYSTREAAEAGGGE